MTAAKPTMALGWRAYGLGVIALGMVCLAWGDFDPGQPVPQLAPFLPLQIPAPLAIGEPADGYPWKWCIRRWIAGETAAGTHQ